MRPLWLSLLLCIVACAHDYMTSFNERVAEHPRDPEAYFARAKMYSNRAPETAPECIADADQAIALGPESPNRYRFFGLRGLCKASVVLGKNWYEERYVGPKGDVLPPEKRSSLDAARADFETAKSLLPAGHKARAALLEATARLAYKAGDHQRAHEDLVALWALLVDAKYSWSDAGFVGDDGRTELLWFVSLASVDARNAEARLKEAREKSSPSLAAVEETSAASKERFERLSALLDRQQRDSVRAENEKRWAERTSTQQRRQQALEDRDKKYPNHETCPRCNGTGEIAYVDYGEVARCRSLNQEYKLCTSGRSGGDRTATCPLCNGVGLVPRKRPRPPD